jgi:hypothetical protein
VGVRCLWFEFSPLSLFVSRCHFYVSTTTLDIVSSAGPIQAIPAGTSGWADYIHHGGQCSREGASLQASGPGRGPLLTLPGEEVHSPGGQEDTGAPQGLGQRKASLLFSSPPPFSHTHTHTMLPASISPLPSSFLLFLPLTYLSLLVGCSFALLGIWFNPSGAKTKTPIGLM